MEGSVNVSCSIGLGMRVSTGHGGCRHQHHGLLRPRNARLSPKLAWWRPLPLSALALCTVYCGQGGPPPTVDWPRLVPLAKITTSSARVPSSLYSVGQSSRTTDQFLSEQETTRVCANAHAPETAYWTCHLSVPQEQKKTAQNLPGTHPCTGGSTPSAVPKRYLPGLFHAWMAAKGRNERYCNCYVVFLTTPSATFFFFFLFSFFWRSSCLQGSCRHASSFNMRARGHLAAVFLLRLSPQAMVFCIGIMSQVAVVPNSELGEPPVELGQPSLQFRQRVSAWEHMVHLSDMLPH